MLLSAITMRKIHDLIYILGVCVVNTYMCVRVCVSFGLTTLLYASFCSAFSFCTVVSNNLFYFLRINMKRTFFCQISFN